MVEFPPSGNFMIQPNQVQVNREGFTLTELMVVILIVGVLAGLIFSIASGVFDKGDRSRAASELESISVALEVYRARFGDYPDVDSSRRLFDALDGRLGPDGRTLIPSFPPFLEAGRFNLSDAETPELLDPWGGPYVYHYERDASTRISGYQLFSKGPDGKSSRTGNSAETIDEDNLRYDD